VSGNKPEQIQDVSLTEKIGGDMKRELIIFVSVFFLIFVTGCATEKIKVAPPGSGIKKTQKMQPARGLIKGKELAVQKDQEQALRERQLKEEQLARARQKAEEKKAMEQVVKTISANKIYFDFDSFELKPEARAILQQKAELLKKYKNLRLVIEGHCDERGTEEYNLALGERRARAAYEFLILLGVESNRLQIVSYGEEFPADPGHNETAWAKNRRDEFKVLY
jgi:peptidoglycan-associated lipoprotein